MSSFGRSLNQDHNFPSLQLRGDLERDDLSSMCFSHTPWFNVEGVHVVHGISCGEGWGL